MPDSSDDPPSKRRRVLRWLFASPSRSLGGSLAGIALWLYIGGLQIWLGFREHRLRGWQTLWVALLLIQIANYGRSAVLAYWRQRASRS